jgi:GR25 family glycosyltransferase involved in LPS biosynthesis
MIEYNKYYNMSLCVEDIPAFCINLEKRKDRWERINGRFKEHGLNVTRWNATTPDKVLGKYVSYLTPVQRACTYSHISVFLHVLEMKYEYALIFEDDVCFRHDWKDILNSKLSTISHDDPQWDAIFLNVSEEITPFETWKPIQNHCLAGAYIIRRHAIQYILNYYYDTLYMIDWMTQILQARGHTYSYFPWLVIQEGSTSDLQNGIPDADFKKVKRLLSWANYPIMNYDIGADMI